MAEAVRGTPPGEERQGDAAAAIAGGGGRPHIRSIETQPDDARARRPERLPLGRGRSDDEEVGSLRFLAWCLRAVGLLILAAGAVLAVGDAARSLASNSVRLMTISETLALTGLSTPLTPPASADPVFTGGDRGRLVTEIGRQPASVVLGIAGLVFLAAGRAPRAARTGEPTRRI